MPQSVDLITVQRIVHFVQWTSAASAGTSADDAAAATDATVADTLGSSGGPGSVSGDSANAGGDVSPAFAGKGCALIQSAVLLSGAAE
jgi:hypothetical protein